jgi:Zn-dependent M16 (insulinase) family peptidase
MDRSTRKVSGVFTPDANLFNIVCRYYINNPSVVIRARPSAALAESLESTEKARIITQRETLGAVGLARLEKALKEAKAEHDRPIPNEILTGFPVPDVKSISWIPVDSVQNNENGAVKRTAAVGVRSGGLEEHIRKDPTALPYFVQFDHVKVRPPYRLFSKLLNSS